MLIVKRYLYGIIYVHKMKPSEDISLIFLSSIHAFKF
jgi:hypothetical protein